MMTRLFLSTNAKLTNTDTTDGDMPNITVTVVPLSSAKGLLRRCFSPLLFGFMTLFFTFFLTVQPANAWLEKLLPKDDVHAVRATDRDVAFLIDDYIYDARDFCYMQAGDKVVFLEGRYGLDYRASVYNLTGKARCEILLRERYQPQDTNDNAVNSGDTANRSNHYSSGENQYGY